MNPLKIAVVLVALGTVQVRCQMVGINVMLSEPPGVALLGELGNHGHVLDVLPEINAVTMRVDASELQAIQSLPWVASAEQDADCELIASSDACVTDFVSGASLWNLDAINVTDAGAGRTIAYDGAGVYIALVDSGLPHNWRNYFPEERIATQFAIAFGGGGGSQGTISTQPEKWENSTNEHGTTLVSVLLGFNYHGAQAFNGVAPRATIIPVRTYGEDNFTPTSVNARGILYVANLKAGGLLGSAPLVLSLSFGGLTPRPLIRAAIHYAIAQGVIVVAGAGNSAAAGMVYPAAYPEVISVGAAGSVGQWPVDDPTTIWWILRDVVENDPMQHFVANFSSRAHPGQDLDVLAPGSAIPTAFTQTGQMDYSFASGTSQAAPHVAGVAALMLQKNPTLTQSQIEAILEATSMSMAPGCRGLMDVGIGPGNNPTWGDHDNVFFFPTTFCWDANGSGHGLVQADAALNATPLP